MIKLYTYILAVVFILVAGIGFPGKLAIAQTGESTVVHSIGSIGRDFATLQEWEDARDGDLVNRHYFAISNQATAFVEGEIVTGASGSGTYVKERTVPSATETHMSLDNVVGSFAAGENITGATYGANATINNILSTTGTLEKGEAYADGVFDTGIVIDGSTTDAAHYMWLRAASSQQHKGQAGGGVVIDTNVLV